MTSAILPYGSPGTRWFNMFVQTHLSRAVARQFPPDRTRHVDIVGPYGCSQANDRSTEHWNLLTPSSRI
ncbi:hypothetical protein HYDPIDRAFT_112925 [Hydnomerulius pinastri MD-312]|uniref:Uncharacterized protein n=1 Tax=Hydnomerulius pinastri MD-312 TaxID=994086 RepID=A0A0C9VD48_9AGAM|nr:hypothetical protein HYDPIDRAFT_114549 [Hydnomerulius pinastri MD-312]KIJ63504.1 hypothetical protein HYDPIDRAFT_112925 [Hydnomerulius pinastri MD-312]